MMGRPRGGYRAWDFECSQSMPYTATVACAGWGGFIGFVPGQLRGGRDFWLMNGM